MANKERTREEELEITVKWLRRQKERLERNSVIDGLTGALRRSAFSRELDRALAVVTSGNKRYGDVQSSYGLLFIDLDNFKPVNDGGGHLAGDEVLRNVSKSLKRVLRQDDILARYGGDEFVIIARVLNENHLMSLAERIRRAVCGTVTHCGDRCWRVTASIGATLIDPADTPDTVIERADIATYEAKGQKKEGGAWQYAWRA